MIFTDQLNRTVELTHFPQRIISLVPSQTELLADLGLDEEVVGITKFCVHPQDWFRRKTRVGGTKQYHFDRIDALSPDLIIANLEENEREQVEQLMKRYPVWISNVKNLTDALAMIQQIGQMTNRMKPAQKICQNIGDDFTQLQETLGQERPLSTVYLIWQNPFMVAGGDTFISDMLNQAGLENMFADRNRYPSVTLETLQNLAPEVVLLSSEPFPFSQRHRQELQTLLPQSQVVLVDGELFSWYGSRLQLSASYFQTISDGIRQNLR